MIKPYTPDLDEYKRMQREISVLKTTLQIEQAKSDELVKQIRRTRECLEKLIDRRKG